MIMMYTKYKPYTKEKHVQFFRRVIKKYGFNAVKSNG